MDEFKQSKKQILTEIYIRELPLILNHINHRRKMKRDEEKFRRAVGFSDLLDIAVATAGMAPSGENIEKLIERSRSLLKEFMPKEEQSNETQDPYERLKALQGTMSQKRARKRG